MRSDIMLKEPELSFDSIHQELNNFLRDTFMESIFSHPLNLRKISTWRPAIELKQTDKEYKVKVQLPGVNKEDIHIDLNNDYMTVSANRQIVGDAKIILRDMLNEFKSRKHEINQESKDKWFEKINDWKKQRVIPDIQSDKLHAHMVLEKIYEYTKPFDPIICTEVGQHQMWTAQMFNFNQPRRLVTSGGLGTMGFGFPAAMGACVADKNKLVINIAGDGSIQMNVQELATCVEYNLPVKVIIMNNGYLGMVRQWQERLFDKHYSETKISSPDFVKVAEAYGAKGIRVEKEEDIIPAIKEAIEYPGPVFLDFIVEPFETVYPWVLAGKPMHEVLLSNEG